MTTTNRPVSLVPGWQGAWALNVRPVLVAIRDRGPLTLQEVASVLRSSALHADLTSGHHLGPVHGSEMLARAVLEDAADVLTEEDGRYSMPADVRQFVSRWTGQTMALLSAEEDAASSAASLAERPVRHWNAKGVYNPYGGKWSDGRLPGRKYTIKDVSEMADVIRSLGWQSGARIVKDQNGVTIDGHLRADALGSLSIDPDTGTDPMTGEPYVEIRSFQSDAARLHFALAANWTTMLTPTRTAIAKQVFGLDKAADLTLEMITTLLVPVARRMALHSVPDVEVDDMEEDEPLTARQLSAEDEDLVARIDYAGPAGVTTVELGSTSALTGRLSKLEDIGVILRVANARRDGCDPYITPQWRQGRPKARRKRAKTTIVASPPTPTVAWTNPDLAALAFKEAFTANRPNGQSARVFFSTGAKITQPVADHIPGLVASMNASYPGLLKMLCDYQAERSH